LPCLSSRWLDFISFFLSVLPLLFLGYILHFQTFVTYSSHYHGKVVKTEIVSTRAACTDIPFYPLGATSTLTLCRIVPSLWLAQEYIAHTIRVHPGSTPPPTVIDGKQGELF
jgi:hypothetical protein